MKTNGLLSEDFIAYIWQFQKWSDTKLLTTDKKEIVVLQTGFRNEDAGPDFCQARMLIDGIEWVGDVEIHQTSADWKLHGHQNNPAYNSVILHLIYQKPGAVFRQDGTQIPELVAHEFCHEDLESAYKNYFDSKNELLCFGFQIDKIKQIQALETALAHRLQRKATELMDLLIDNHWEQAVYWYGAQVFGFKTNAQPMEQIARQLPLPVLLKHRDQPSYIYAMLAHMSNLFSECSRVDPKILEIDVAFYVQKFQLKEGQMPKANWKYSRMRPKSFPEIRLFQWAHWLTNTPSLFQSVLSIQSENDLKTIFKNCHEAKLGANSYQYLIINLISVVQFAYGHYTSDQSLKDRAVALLEKTKSESNFITKKFVNWPLQSAADSQGCIELFQKFCVAKRCLHCPVGLVCLQKTL